MLKNHPSCSTDFTPFLEASGTLFENYRRNNGRQCGRDRNQGDVLKIFQERISHPITESGITSISISESKFESESAFESISVFVFIYEYV